MIGAAEAAAIEAIGKAEAERMRQKAAAYKQYGDAALMSLILEAMPKVKHYTIKKCRWYYFFMLMSLLLVILVCVLFVVNKIFTLVFVLTF